MDLLIVYLASALAGCIDAIVGGGGLVLAPTLFATYPGAPPATLFGTNKSAAIWGTSLASWQYSRRVQLAWRPMGLAMGLGFVGSLIGAWAVTQVSPRLLRQALPLALLAVLAYTLAKKDLGRTQALRLHGSRHLLALGLIAWGLGLYDGFFGPGTGSFLVFLLVRVLGYDFLHASASAKLINLSTNLSALLLFGLKGHVWWHLALGMALANLAGSWLGTRLALRHGSGFVRSAFLLVVSALILKTGFDAFLR